MQFCSPTKSFSHQIGYIFISNYIRHHYSQKTFQTFAKAKYLKKKKKLVELLYLLMVYFFVTPNQAIFNKIISYCTYIKYILYRRYGICVMCIHTVYVKWKNHIVGIKCSHLDPTLARAALSLTQHCLDQSSVLTQRCPVRRWSIKKIFLKLGCKII